MRYNQCMNNNTCIHILLALIVVLLLLIIWVTFSNHTQLTAITELLTGDQTTIEEYYEN